MQISKQFVLSLRKKILISAHFKRIFNGNTLNQAEINVFTLFTNNCFKLNCFGLTNHQTDIGKMASIYFNQLPNALDVKLSTVGKD